MAVDYGYVNGRSNFLDISVSHTPYFIRLWSFGCVLSSTQGGTFIVVQSRWKPLAKGGETR